MPECVQRLENGRERNPDVRPQVGKIELLHEYYISGGCSDDNERLCAIELHLRLRRFHLE